MSILDEDLARICEASYIPWDSLRGCRILITGATGLIGGLLARSLVLANQKRELGIKIIALVRNVERAKSLPIEVERLCADVTSPVNYYGAIDYIIHAASETSSRNFVEHPVETVTTAFEGTRNVLDLAMAKGVRGFLYVSSMEMYGEPDQSNYAVTERDGGYLDTMAVRSSYPEGKRISETLCCAYASEYGVPVKVARLVQTFGPGVSKTENRVFAQFARAVMEGRPIVLKTDGSKAHCYCYTADAVTGLLTVLLKGKVGEAYNVSNEDTFMSIRDMANMLTKNVIMELDNSGVYPPSAKMKVVSSKLRALGWCPTVGLGEMYSRLMEWMNAAF